jgi:6-phosphogluconolactonase (cycloisomerase 2 family)
VSRDGRYAYTTNAGSGSVSGYAIAHDGSLTLLDSQAGDTGAGSAPIDAGFSANGRYLYVLTAGSHEIVPFALNADGSLTELAAVTGLPAGMVGLAAR